MWAILSETVLQEWFGIRLPPNRLPWQGWVYLPNGFQLLYCLDRQSARQLKAETARRYFSLEQTADAMSIFAGFGLDVPDDLAREREGLTFLSRQAEHVRSLSDYLFVVREAIKFEAESTAKLPE